jgi:hypothetical protein
MEQGLAPTKGYRTQPSVSTLGNPQNKRFALIRGERCGYQMKLAPIAAQSQSGQLERATIGPSDPASALLGRSIWRSLQGASLWVDDSQG